jgi:glycosyltransferase involved in cell wall biosynthesis
MHICFITHEYPKPGFAHGGIGTFVRTMGTALVEAGHNVSVVGAWDGSFDICENDNGVNIYRVASLRIKGITWLLTARKINRQIDIINKKEPIDIVEASEPGLAFIKKSKGIKYIIRLHGGHYFFAEAERRGINRWKGFQERRSFRKADMVVGVGKYVMEHTGKLIDFSKKCGPVIYNPIDVSRFYQADPHKTVPGRILFIGTVTEKKGIRQLTEAMPAIREAVPGATLYVAGRDRLLADGRSYIDYLKQFIPEEIKSSIIFAGPVSYNEIPQLIEQAEVCVFPSHMETFGLVAIEAMCMGKPVVFTRKGPGPEIITDGITGLLCDPTDPSDIAEKTIRILKNRDLGLALGKNARDEVLLRFSSETLIKQNVHFYNELVN